MANERRGSPDAPGGHRLGYIPALDGLRALAVLSVMAYHGGLGWAKGGFLGVDAFFVLSGFLITSLLVKEWRQTGRIALPAFWARRARRLLPALFLLLGGIALYAWLVAPPDTLDTLRFDALATLAYVANWHQIVAGQGYFAQQALPSPLLHTWSLGIEEQFYIVWPLVVLGMLKWRRSPRALLVLTVAGALASATAMGLLYHPGIDPARVYYGTDTRAQSLLIGAALALIIGSRAPARTIAGRGTLISGAVAGAAGVAWAITALDGNSSALYRGGFAAVAVAVAAVLAGVVLAPDNLPARVLSVPPLRYIGRISYGLYLWHWPIFLTFDHARTGLSGLSLLGVRVAISFAVAVLSFHLVEMPVRRGALRSWRGRIVTPAAALAAAAGVLVSTAPAVSALPNLAAISSGTLASSSSAPSSNGHAGAGLGGAPVHVAVVGDSVALTLAIGLSGHAPGYGVRLADDATVGCGVAGGGLINDRGKIGESIPACSSWTQKWANVVKTESPDVAAIVVGRWEALNRVHNGRWEHLGEPDYDAFIESQLDLGVRILSSRGAKVALLTSPYFYTGEQPNGAPWPQEDPARVNRMNSIIRAVAARHPGVATVIPLGRYLDPDGHFSTLVNGITVRPSDGVHITLAASGMLAPKILPTLARLGHERRAAPAQR